MADALNAAQVAAIEGRIKAAIEQVRDQMNLRKYAIQAALDMKASDPVAVAEKIFEFISAPATQVVVRIEQ